MKGAKFADGDGGCADTREYVWLPNPFGEAPGAPVAGSKIPGIVFDDRGEGWPARSLRLARRLARAEDDRSTLSRAVSECGFVYLKPLEDTVLVTFEPAALSPVAMTAAFYEIFARAPKRLVLASPGPPGGPDRYEVFDDMAAGLRRLEGVAGAVGQRVVRALPTGEPLAARRRLPRAWRDQPAKTPSPSLSARPRRRRRAPQVADISIILPRPLAAIAADDAWLGQLLGLWGNARRGRHLPSSESLDPLELLNIARGRAHIVEVASSNPTAYRFRLWGTVNSYGEGYANRTLGEMPPSPMRDEAIGDYRWVVTTGRPSYHLIRHTEQQFSYSYARLLLPLAQDGRRADRLVVLINERLLPELEAP